MSVPRLATALTGPLPHLERHLLGATATIEHWLRGQWQERENGLLLHHVSPLQRLIVGTADSAPLAFTPM